MVICSGHPRALTQGPFLMRGHGPFSGPTPPETSVPHLSHFPHLLGTAGDKHISSGTIMAPIFQAGGTAAQGGDQLPRVWQRRLAWQGGR